MKENEMIEIFWDLTRKLKKLWNMTVSVLSVVVGTLGTVATYLEKRQEEMEISIRIETLPMTAILNRK